jgi:hypothetical protein
MVRKIKQVNCWMGRSAPSIPIHRKLKEQALPTQWQEETAQVQTETMQQIMDSSILSITAFICICLHISQVFLCHKI